MGLFTVGCSLGDKKTVQECLKYFEDHEEIQVDTETTGVDPHQHKIVSLQIGDTENQWFIDTRKVDILLFKNLIESKLCILHNSKFDYKFFKKVGIMLDRIFDTMLAECLIYCGYANWGYGLDKVNERYLNESMSKQERMTFTRIGEQEFTMAQIEYGCKDVMNLQIIKEKQMNRIRAYEMEYCMNLENQVVKAFGDMEYNGVKLNTDEWRLVTKHYKEEIIKIERRMDAILETDPKLIAYRPKGKQQNLFGLEERHVKVNYGSPIQVKNICHALGYKVETTNEREIGKLAKTEDGKVTYAKHPFFGELLLSREVSKIISTYGDSFLEYINPATGRIHTDFWQIKDTGRVGSGDPNMQNLPALGKEVEINGKKVMTYPFRNCFKARPGFKWVSIDYSGQELRIMAEGSGEQGFIDVLNDKTKDLHCYAGEMMFKRPIDKKKDKALREKAKKINFGKPYGMGPDKLADMLDIPLEEAAELFKLYGDAFPVLNKWLDDQGKFAIAKGYSKTFPPCKRIRWYPDMKKARELRKTVQKGDKETWRTIMVTEGQTQRNGMNSPIQGTGADITKDALIKVRELILKFNETYEQEIAFLLLTVHDAIDVEVHESVAVLFAEEMAKIMIACGNKYVHKVNMEVDTTITDYWTK